MVSFSSASPSQAVNTARGGVLKAQNQFNKAAKNVIRSYEAASGALHNASTNATSSTTVAPTAPIQPTATKAPTLTTPVFDSFEPIRSTVGMLQAKHAYSASLNLLKTAVEMEKTAISKLA